MCRSCDLIELAYPRQLELKDGQVRDALAGVAPRVRWSEPHRSVPWGYRNKAKLAVGGTPRRPALGIVDPASGQITDLRRCPLYEPALAGALPRLAEVVTGLGLAPYDIPRRRGDLKYLIVTVSPDRELMIRFVVRDERSVPRIEAALPHLYASVPGARVVSANIHPEHKAVLEGEREIVLSARRTLPLRLPGAAVRLAPKSFFQTNTAVAAGLYAQATAWLAESMPATVWDLYCGVGGFALHAATADPAPPRIVGVEVEPDAIRAARRGAAWMVGRHPGVAGIEFVAADATAWATARPGADTVIVNPPRRGIGPELASWLNGAPQVREVIYSSCRVRSLAADLAAMPAFEATQARLFDMFPQTSHHEVMVRLRRR